MREHRLKRSRSRPWTREIGGMTNLKFNVMFAGSLTTMLQNAIIIPNYATQNANFANTKEKMTILFY